MTKIQERIAASALHRAFSKLQGSLVQVVTHDARTQVVYLQKLDDAYLYGRNMRQKKSRIALSEIAEVIIDKRQEEGNAAAPGH